MEWRKVGWAAAIVGVAACSGSDGRGDTATATLGLSTSGSTGDATTGPASSSDATSTTSTSTSETSTSPSTSPSTSTSDASTASTSTTSTTSTTGDSSTSGGATTTGEATTGEATSTSDGGTTGVEPGCGDGVVQPIEECDDGNLIDADGCNADCVPSGKLLWSEAVGGAVGEAEEAYGAAVDPLGNFYAAGFIAPSLTNHDVWHRKYDPDLKPLWTQTYDGPAKTKDQARALVVDAGQAYYVGGYQAVVNASNDALLRRHGADGTAAWTKSFNGAANGSDLLLDAAIDSNGDVIVVGQVTTVSDGTDAWLRKYSAAGAVLWTRTYGGVAKGNDAAHGVAAASGGYFYVTGTETVTNESNNMWLGKYDPDGNLVWSKVRNGPGNKADFLMGAAADPSGDVVVCGYEGMLTYPWEVWVRRYDAAGAIVWTDVYGGESGEGAICHDIARDQDGNFVITGGEMVGTVRQILVRKYDADGKALWTKKVPAKAAGPDHGRALAVGPDKTIFVVGTADVGADGRDMWFGRFTP